jgi:hypothetical protein
MYHVQKLHILPTECISVLHMIYIYIYIYIPAQNQPTCFIIGWQYDNCAVGTKYLSTIRVKYIFYFGIYEIVELNNQ